MSKITDLENDPFFTGQPTISAETLHEEYQKSMKEKATTSNEGNEISSNHSFVVFKISMECEFAYIRFFLPITFFFLKGFTVVFENFFF